MSTLQESNLFGLAGYVPGTEPCGATTYRHVYEQNRHRIYGLAFWATNSELAAEEVMTNAFCRAFAKSEAPTPEQIDCALIAEVRQYLSLGTLTLDCAGCDKISRVRSNTLRVDLERALVQLPNTEKMIFLMHDMEGYDYARIARTLGLSEDESRRGLHQARLRIRELLAK